MTCAITGLLVDPTGVILPNTSVVFVRSQQVAGNGAATVVGRDVATTSSASGMISANLEPGNYTGNVTGTRGVFSFAVGVPDSPTANLHDIIDQNAVVTPGIVQVAVDARDLSRAWAEGTLPGGAGTKSSREWAEAAQAATATIPAPAGNALKYSRVNAAETAYEARTPAQVLVDIGAAASGVNNDITSLSGLTTPLSVAQGGTGANDAAGARTKIGAAAAGANSDITSLDGLTTALPVEQGGTGSTTAEGALSNLGITVPASLINGGPDNENRIINGAFDFWQRGTSHNTSGYGSADRWRISFTGGAFSLTKVNETLGVLLGANNPGSFARLSVSGQTLSNHVAYLEQSIEGVRSYAGQTITVLGWARRVSGAGNMAVAMYQVFGTGGSPSPSVNGVGQQVALSSNWAPFAVTFNVPSVSGKTLGTDGNDYALLRFFASAGSSFGADVASLGLQTIGIDLWGIHIRIGTHTTAACAAYRAPELGPELARCQRYYSPAHVSVTSPVAGFFGVQWYTRVPMRAVPSLTVVSAGVASNATPTSDLAQNVYGGSFQMQATVAGGYISGRAYRLDAEL